MHIQRRYEVATSSLEGVSQVDSVRAFAAAHQLRAIKTEDLPMVAAMLVAEGHESEGLLELACLSATSSPWAIDAALAHTLEELGIEPPSLDESSGVVAQLLLLSHPDEDHPVLRRFARLPYRFEPHSDLLFEAMSCAEYLDCDCIPGARERAHEFEDRIRARPRLDVTTDFADDLTRALQPRTFGHDDY